MRSMWQILCAVIDGEITTPEQGSALLAEESKEYAVVLKIPEAQARAQLRSNIADCATLCLSSDAAKIREFFLLGNEADR